MRKKKILRWNYVPQMEDMLFFANILDEMTFNYTLDSFKASVHNIFSLIRECIETINDIDKETIKKGALPPVIEEVKDEMEKDSIMIQVCKTNRLDLLLPKIDNNTERDELRTILEMFISSSIVKQYNELIKKTLSETIKAAANQKKKIEKLSRQFVAQMKFMGYPNASIYKKTKDFFFSPNTNIQSVNNIDTFLSLFDFDQQEYVVCLFGCHLYDYIKNSLQNVGIDINNTFVPSQWDASFANYDTLQNQSKYILVKIEGYDEYAAMAHAIDKVVHFTSLYTFFHHKERFNYVDEFSLVLRVKDGQSFKVRMPMPKILACKDEKPQKAALLYNANITKISMDTDSYFRFVKSIRLHDSALRSDHEENQFLNLFTAFEVLIPKAANSGKDRILQISEVLLPYLCHSHFLRLASSFGQDFRLWKMKLYNSIIAQISEGTTEDEKMCALIALAKYQPLRDQIFNAATTDNHVLLRYRLYKLNNRMGSVRNVKSTYKKFQERMKWHVTRLYRTRNLIVHAGTKPRYLDLLLENIHSFYDTFMRELILDITDKGMMKLEYSYILRQSRHNNYINYLETINNTTVIDENNYADVLGFK